MQAAPKHTVPAYLFELQHGEDTLHGGGSDIHDLGGEVPGRHHAADLRQFSRGTASFTERGNTRGFTLACDDKTDRFGPGTLSLRHNRTKRLRELRARRSAGPVRGLRNATHVSRGVGGGSASPKARTDGPAHAETCGSKRRRASSGGAYQVESQRLPLERPVVLAQAISQQPEVPVTGLIGAGTHNTSRDPSRGEDGYSQGYCGGWSRSDSGLNEALTASNQTPGTAEDAGRRRRINASMVPLGSLDEGPSVDSGSTNNSGNSGQPATVRLSQIIPVRSAPVSWRPLAATGARGVLSRSGSKKTSQVLEKEVQQHNNHKHKKYDAAATSVAGGEGGVAEGVVVASIRGATIAPSNANGAVVDARAGHGDDACKSLGLLAESKQGFPGIADTCGGIALRLTPGERSLEPLGTTLAPLRAMCDIEPSLSRAGMEYRAVIHAVEGAQELKSHHHIKRKKARDAKALLGEDIRPRTSEPRMRIAGVTSELDVLKTILVRERLIVTLRRLIRRLRRHCSKLQDFLRREIKFRWRYGKPPPEVLVCATQSIRKTVHTEQQELRVVLAHLRAISFDTVHAISEWRATFETSEGTWYRQISRTVSAPSLHCKPPLLRCPAEQEGICHSGSIACDGGQTTEKVDGHQNNQSENAVNFLSGGAPVGQEKGGETDTQRDKDLGFRGGDNDSKAASSKTASRQDIKSSSSRSNPSTIFLWKGRNYLGKMAHDLDFLDDENVAAPVPAWLGFSVHRNPFLIPPNGHDIREILRLGHEERCKEIAARRRQRQQQHHRFGGAGNGRRRSSRSRSRSRANSSTNRQRGSGDGDIFAPSSHRQSGQGQESDPGCGRTDNAPEATQKPPYQDLQPTQKGTYPNTTENDLPPRAGSAALPGGRESGDTFVTEIGIATADESLASASTSVEPPLSWGLGDLKDEDITCELSSGEEEEVQWSGGGFLGLPIIPELPEAVRSKASEAEETLRSEGAAENDLESNALEIVANAKRTQDILHQPNQEHSSRVEWLAERSFRNGLRGALVDRHVGATRLKSASSSSCWQDEPIVRRVSTAPAGRVGAVQRSYRSCASSAVAKSATRKQEIQDLNSAAVGKSRGGVCVSVDGGAERGDNELTEDAHESLTPAQSRRPANNSRNSTSRRRGPSASRLRRPDALSARASEGSIGSVSATSLTGRSMAASSLQASSSSMSGRARARAVAMRPTALRRPFCRNGGRIIITDPGNLPEIRHKAAILIQSALLAVCSRLFVRRLRADRERAALLIGQNWRRSRVRLRMRNAKRSRRAEELRQVAEGRTRNRAAYQLQIFFRDIKYRRKRDRHELFLKNREHVPSELREQNAVIMVQATIRRCLASNRLKRIRHRRRGQAQARIARAARERAVFARRKELADREREEENALKLEMKRRSLRLDEAAIRLQAWFRGVNSRRTIVTAALSAKEEPTPAKKVHPQGIKSAYLQAALDALREAHSAMKNTENEKGKINHEDQSPRARKGVTDADGCSSPNADELRWEARVSERKHTPSRVHAER